MYHLTPTMRSMCSDTGIGTNTTSGFVTTSTLSLKDACAVANAVVEAAKRNGFNPVTVTVVDPSGDILAVHRMDGCPAGAFPEYSLAKARTAVNHMTSSRAMRDKYTPVGTAKPQDFSKMTQLLAMVDTKGGMLAPFPGGVLLRNRWDNSVVGAIGVSGAAGDEDEYCALQGAKVVSGLVITEPAAHSCKTIRQ